MSYEGIPPVVAEAIRRIDEKIESIPPTISEQIRRVDEKINQLIAMDERRNGRWDEHIKEDNVVHLMVQEHENSFNSIGWMKKIMITTLITMVLSSFGNIGWWSYSFGQTNKQVQDDRSRVERLESKIFPINEYK